MALTNNVTWEKLRTLDTSTMSSSSTYYNIGTPITNPSYKIKVINNSNVLVTLSIDGTNDHDVLPAGSFFLYDETQAQISTANAPAVPAGTQFSVKSATAGIGLIYLATQYLMVN